MKGTSAAAVAPPVESTALPLRWPDPESLPPAMRQYVEQKLRVGDALLLFRMGDFYETFYEDAILCAKVLGIVLTTRDKNSPNPVPLAGIPYHALDSYLRKLVAAGYRVAVSEQLEDPKEAKGVVKRDVVRIVTAGTLTDETLLPDRADNLLACLCAGGDGVGCAVMDLTAGRFEALEVARAHVLDELVRLAPAEVLIDDDRHGEAERIAEQLRCLSGCAITRRPRHEFGVYQAERSLLGHFGVATLAGFGWEKMNAALCAAGVILQYLAETQRTALPHIRAILRRDCGDFLHMDHGTWRALEIESTLRGGQMEGSLRQAIDRTVHPPGARKLRQWLRYPLRCATDIAARQDGVAFLVDDESARRRVRGWLKEFADVERIAGRTAIGRTNPRDLAGLGRTLAALPPLAGDLAVSGVAVLRSIAEDLGGLDDLSEMLRQSIVPDPPPHLREGGVIADGWNAELDRLRAVQRDGQRWLAEYQRREIERTGLNNLKVGFNRVFGYYLEVPRSGDGRVPGDFVRRQTVKNAERYITDELKQYENEVLTAQERALTLEEKLFEEVRVRVAARSEALLRAADALGRLDVLAGFAELAAQRRHVRPQIVEEPLLDIRDGRHPVLDVTLGDRFVPNDTLMNDDARVLVITGPNMAGKSTYIRQVALLTLMAQVGCFVPARGMTLGPADRLFARVGSADEIMRNRSTFMVEMIEAATILHHATSRSLVVLDELGRGTSTFDGLSLAWAITEHLAAVTGCRTLVATHYHELTELAELLRGVKNYHVAVRAVPPGAAGDFEGEEGDSLVFLHRIVEGGTNRSYGIHVARLAGVPKAVVQRATQVLKELQRQFTREAHAPRLAARKSKPDREQLPLFPDVGGELLEALRAVDPERLTPLEALQRLQEWKSRYS